MDFIYDADLRKVYEIIKDYRQPATNLLSALGMVLYKNWLNKEDDDNS